MFHDSTGFVLMRHHPSMKRLSDLGLVTKLRYEPAMSMSPTISVFSLGLTLITRWLSDSKT